VQVKTDIAFVDVEFLGHPGVIGTGVLRSDRGVWLVDPGPTTALEGLRRGLDTLGLSFADVRGLLLTHIHLDHAGATGTIVRQWPDIRVFVHERGAPHLIDPSRLMESAGRLYAGDLQRLWGEVAPVPEANVHVLKGGESLTLDGRTLHVAYTPGHASHHVSYFDPATRAAFVGDTGGARLMPGGYLMPPTPPPDIDLAAWGTSIAAIRARNPSRLYLTHFGEVERPAEHLATLEQQLALFAQMVAATLEEPGEDRERMERFVARVVAQFGRVMSPEDAYRYQAAVPLDHCWLGLARYWRKRATAAAASRP
jgi:glyoxylase-like metal-dependent hydrolase (beta-lactamase superfamily II)